MKSFWNTLPSPFFALAPMADVTDISFRTLFARYGKPEVMWTEFVSADGLFLAPFQKRWPDLPYNERVQEIAAICESFGVAHNNPLILDLVYYDAERPIIVQFFSTNPERMEKAGALAKALGFDGIDLNMGCPADVICSQGAGSAMIKTPEKAQEVIRATKRGAQDIPLSVKTRIGFNTPDVESWVSTLLNESIQALTLHARTRKEMSHVPAQWSYVRDAVALRDTYAQDTVIIGNGDVVSIADGLLKQQSTGCDGVMVGRGIFGNPWFFTFHTPSVPERLRALREHTELFLTYQGKHKSFALMKKHIKAYIHGFEGSKHLRELCMACETEQDLIHVITCELSKELIYSKTNE